MTLSKGTQYTITNLDMEHGQKDLCKCAGPPPTFCPAVRSLKLLIPENTNELVAKSENLTT